MPPHWHTNKRDQVSENILEEASQQDEQTEVTNHLRIFVYLEIHRAKVEMMKRNEMRNNEGG